MIIWVWGTFATTTCSLVQQQNNLQILRTPKTTTMIMIMNMKSKTMVINNMSLFFLMPRLFFLLTTVTIMRFFMVQSVTKTGQRNEKGREKKTKGYDLVFKGENPGQAAKKAMSALCKRKEYHGMCALRVKFMEVKGSLAGTSPSKTKGKYIPLLRASGEPKIYAYRLQKRKLKEPVTLMLNGVKVTYKYESKIRSDLNKKRIAKMTSKIKSGVKSGRM